MLDNATMHTSRVIRRFLKRHEWVLFFEHLTPCSPAYNPIERFWQWRKANVYGASTFETLEGVIGTMQKLNLV
jgi:transposase